MPLDPQCGVCRRHQSSGLFIHMGLKLTLSSDNSKESDTATNDVCDGCKLIFEQSASITFPNLLKAKKGVTDGKNNNEARSESSVGDV